MLILAFILGLPLALYLALRLAPYWVRWMDRAPGNDTGKLPYSYELPRYFRRDATGNVDTSARWPGWDAWTVCAIPEDGTMPPKMIRGTLMTGLYGLEGIDNYENLIYRLSSYHAVEHLCLVPTAYRAPDERTTVLANLCQHYLSKNPDLAMDDASLDVTILGSRVGNEVTDVPYARVRGTWPDYRILLLQPESEIRMELEYRGERIAWWTDIPGRYTHFAAFGAFTVTMEYARGTAIEDPRRPLRNPEILQFAARGAFEHVSAAKPFGFDQFWLPLRLIGRWFPALKPIFYHYEVLIGETIEGGFVYARAFGVEFRNRGSLFAGAAHHAMARVKLRCLEADAVDDCSGSNVPVAVWRKWAVEAATDAGPLSYTALRTHPVAMSGPNYSQYHFTFEGVWLGQPCKGSGYGEHVHL